MTTVHYRSVPHVATRVATRATLPAWRTSTLVVLVRTWLRRARERRELSELSDAQLRDVGLNRLMVQRELDKPFWMA